jgi:SNF2 family DNA or RNA helicase
MLEKRQLHDYQKRAINHQVNNPRSLLFLGMGLGKSCITLTTIDHLITHGIIRSALILAPLRVCAGTWQQEAKKWGHLEHLTFSHITGSPDQRMSSLFKPANVYLTNYENLPWLSAQLHAYFIGNNLAMPFDMLVCDESTKIKNPSTRRVEALLPLLPNITYRTCLTGTPAANGLLDLFGQFLVTDDGQRLGTTYDAYKNAYFKTSGYRGYTYEIIEGGEAIIHKVISDITMEMSTEDYLKLPRLITYDVHAIMPPQARKLYDKMEKDLFVELDSGTEVDVTSEVGKIVKLLQISNGNLITNSETHEWEPLHNGKLDVLEDIIEEAAGEPILLAYNFRADAARIIDKFKYAVDITKLTGKVFNKAVADFAAGRTKLMIGHPASVSRGIDSLQHGSNIIVWYGLNWSLELTLQMNARLHRQGQVKPVACYRILCLDTFDMVMSDRLTMKDETQKTLLKAISNYRSEKL